MTLQEWQEAVSRTFNKDLTPREFMLNMLVGAMGELGEISEPIKKHEWHLKDLNKEDLKKEIGDLGWYWVGLCSAFGFNVEDVVQVNIDKLKARWPEGFIVHVSSSVK